MAGVGSSPAAQAVSARCGCRPGGPRGRCGLSRPDTPEERGPRTPRLLPGREPVPDQQGGREGNRPDLCRRPRRRGARVHNLYGAARRSQSGPLQDAAGLAPVRQVDLPGRGAREVLTSPCPGTDPEVRGRSTAERHLHEHVRRFARWIPVVSVERFQVGREGNPGRVHGTGLHTRRQASRLVADRRWKHLPLSAFRPVGAHPGRFPGPERRARLFEPEEHHPAGHALERAGRVRSGRRVCAAHRLGRVGRPGNGSNTSSTSERAG